jgi:O-phosphoseryl-tRNA(Cys) synthetase
MRPYRTVRPLSAAECGYIAGLIDGEGTVTLSRRHANELRHVVVSISNTEHELLDHVLALIGCGKITNKKIAKPNHTLSMTFAVSNRQALSPLDQVEPYLRSYKRRRAQLILKYYVPLTPRNGKYSATLRAQRAAFEAELLGIRVGARTRRP